MLHDTVWLIFAHGQSFFQNHHVLYLPNSYRTVKLAYNHSISHNTVHIICSVKIKTWIIFDIWPYMHNIRYMPISIQLNLYRYCITGLMYRNMAIYQCIVTSANILPCHIVMLPYDILTWLVITCL